MPLDAEVSAALISLGGVLVSILVTFVLNLLATRQQKKQLFAETVSARRMEWITAWRTNVAQLVSAAEILWGRESVKIASSHSLDAGNKGSDELELSFFRARAEILVRLNLEETLHMLMFRALEDFDPDHVRALAESGNKPAFEKQKEYVLELTREILKPEWERVKKEGGEE